MKATFQIKLPIILMKPILLILVQERIKKQI